MVLTCLKGGGPPVTADIEGANCFDSQWVKVALSKLKMTEQMRQKMKALRGRRTVMVVRRGMEIVTSFLYIYSYQEEHPIPSSSISWLFTLYIQTTQATWFGLEFRHLCFNNSQKCRSKWWNWFYCKSYQIIYTTTKTTNTISLLITLSLV